MMNDDLAKAQIGGTLSIEWTTSGTLTDSLRHIALIANGMGRAAARRLLAFGLSSFLKSSEPS